MIAKKGIVFIVMTIIIISLLTGCDSSITDKIYNDNSKIASSSDTFGLDDSKETIESGTYTGRFKLSGSGTIWEYKSSSDIDLKAPYTFSVKNGKAKIVLISSDNTVTTLIESPDKATTKETTSLTIPIKKGINRIKVVGYEKPDIEIKLQIEKGAFKKISF